MVYDSVEWIRNGRLQLSFLARKVQLWHGAPLKQIELPLYQGRLSRMRPVNRVITELYNWVTARYVGSDLLISTSCYFAEHAFSKAIKANYILVSGYPRNDILYKSKGADSARGGLLKLNTDDQIVSRIKESRRDRKRIILYMPTFRKDWHNQFDSGVLDIDRMAAFAENNDILLVFKFHPLMASYYNLDELDSIVEYHPGGDVYPILPLCDCLITDYSSIYFDYLFVDKPIIFFPYDLEQYTLDDRPLLFDYEEMTPGKKCYNQEALENAMMNDEDDYKSNRHTVFNKVFDYEDGDASARIWNYIETNYY